VRSRISTSPDPTSEAPARGSWLMGRLVECQWESLRLTSLRVERARCTVLPTQCRRRFCTLPDAFPSEGRADLGYPVATLSVPVVHVPVSFRGFRKHRRTL
jgi:hypothetical protein